MTSSLNYTLKKKININRLITFLLIFFLIYISTETLLFGTSDNSLLIIIGKYFEIIIAVPLFLIICYKQKTIKASMFHLLLILLACTILTIIINQEKINLYIMMISIMIVSFEVCTLIDFADFKDAYSDVMLLLSLSSLLFFFIRLIDSNALAFLPTVRNYLGYEYKTYYLGSFHWSIWASTRNSSIFRESGVFAIYLCLALFFELFHKEKINIFRSAVFVIAAITTFSSTVFVVLPIMFFVFIFFDKNNSFNKKIPISLTIVFIIALLFAFGGDLIKSTKVFEKFTAGTENSSFASRYGSILVNFSLFMKNPFFGNGEYYISNNFAGIAYELNELKIMDNTNSFLFCFSSYGLLYGCLILFGWYNSLKTRNILTSILLILIVVTLFSGENLIHSTLFFIMVFYGYGKEKKSFIN